MPEVTDPDILKELNAGSKPTPKPGATTTAADDDWAKKYLDYPKEAGRHFVSGAGRGALNVLTAAGQDISGGLPMGVLDPALTDVALQEARRKATEATKGWVAPYDPNWPITEHAGEFAGEAAIPSAASAMIPGVGAGRLIEKGIEKGGKWLAGDVASNVAKATKGMPIGIYNKKTGANVANPAREAAKKKATEETEAAHQKAEERAGTVGGVVRQGERGAIAGAIEPTEDRERGAEVGGATAIATEVARRALGNSAAAGGALNAVAATAALVGMERILGHRLSLDMVGNLGVGHLILWETLYRLHLGSGIGKLGSIVGQPAIVGGSAAYATGVKRKEPPPP